MVSANGVPEGSLLMNVGEVDSVMFSEIVPRRMYALYFVSGNRICGRREDK